jgi:soluble cytochrome b562
MLRRVVIGACFACLTAGSAYAVDEPVDEQAVENSACTEALTKAEEIVHDKIETNALSEDDANKVNEMLDEADALCTEGKVDESTATIAKINKMVGGGKAKPVAAPAE